MICKNCGFSSVYYDNEEDNYKCLLCNRIYEIEEPKDYFCIKCDRLIMDRHKRVYVENQLLEDTLSGYKEYICEYCLFGVKPNTEEALIILGHK